MGNILVCLVKREFLSSFGFLCPSPIVRRSPLRVSVRRSVGRSVGRSLRLSIVYPALCFSPAALLVVEPIWFSTIRATTKQRSLMVPASAPPLSGIDLQTHTGTRPLARSFDRSLARWANRSSARLLACLPSRRSTLDFAFANFRNGDLPSRRKPSRVAPPSDAFDIGFSSGRATPTHLLNHSLIPPSGQVAFERDLHRVCK